MKIDTVIRADTVLLHSQDSKRQTEVCMEKSEWTIPDLLQLSGSYWGVCSLHAGVRLDVFTALNGVTSQGLLEKDSGGYRNTPFSAHNLVKGEPGYLGHIILHHHHLMPGWAHLHKAVINGGPVGRDFPQEDEAAERESFLMGMFNLASQLAPRI